MLKKGYILDCKYEIVDVLGQGGMSVVYLARNNRLGNFWAIKEVKKEVQQYTGFLAEPNILKNLSHPGIPRVVDVFYENNNLYMVEDYIQGATLDKIIRKNGSVSAESACKIALKLCDILMYLHSFSPPIIYRDLKPSNIIVVSDENVTLVDFGISRMYRPDKNEDTVLIGTRGYAAPEQYGNGQSSERTDIYGLGATIFCMLTGGDPFNMEKVLDDKKHFENIDKRLLNTIKKCMEISPEKRYQKVEEVKKEIINFLSKQKKSIKYSGASSGSKPKKVIAAITTVLTVIVIAVVLIYFKSSNNSGAAKDSTKQIGAQTTQAAAAQDGGLKAVKVNEFTKDSPDTERNKVVISPKHVYYKGSNLVMEAWVYNGLPRTAYNIRDIHISLYDKDKHLIANGTFNSMDNAAIDPGEDIVWVFSFEGNSTLIQNADLSTLEWKCTEKNYY